MSRIKQRVYVRLILRCLLVYNKPILPYAVVQSGFRYYGVTLSDEELSCMVGSLRMSVRGGLAG